MKTVKIILITILCGLIAFLGMALAWGVRSESGFYRGFGQSYKLAKEWEIPAAEVESLYVNYNMNSNDVYLFEGTGDSIVIREYTNFEGKEEWLSTVEQEGSTLAIRGQRRRSGFFLFGISREDAYVEIYLPSGLLTEMEIVTTSGEISVENGKGYGEAEASSGDVSVSLRSLEGDLDIDTTSGEVRIYLPEDASFAFVFSSASGECETFFDDCLSYNKRGTSAKGDYGSSPDFDISIATSSGDARVGTSTKP